VLIYLGHIFIKDGDINAHMHRVVQIIFFFLFVNWIRLNYSCNLDALNAWYSPKIVSVICMALVFLFFQGSLIEDVATGFGNSRGSFSIWLIQLVVLNFLAQRYISPKSFFDEMLKFFLFVVPIFFLQSVTGSRAGMLGSLLVVGYFMLKRAGYKACFVCVGILLCITVILSNATRNIIKPEMAMDPLRVNEVLIYDDADLSQLDATIAMLDRYSSYRISLVVTAFSTFQVNDLITGVGAGNFQGWIPRYPHLKKFEVHNVFLRMLGEFGVVAFLVLLFIVIKGAWRAFQHGVRAGSWDFFALHLIYISIAMLHPDMLLTAVSTSLVYMYVYAMSIKEISAN
jgi:O-Antigen ligase